MKTKIIPFDLETAKKIQAGEIEGRIVDDCTRRVRIVCFDRKDTYCIVGLYTIGNNEYVLHAKPNGRCSTFDDGGRSLFIELPEEAPKQEFKPFDKVLVRDISKGSWQISFFSHIQDDWFITCNGHMYKECIPYEGNEHLVGTTNKPKEE